MIIYSTLTSTLTQGWNFINFNPLCRTAIHALDLSYLFIRSVYACSNKNTIEDLNIEIEQHIKLSKDPNCSKYQETSNKVQQMVNAVIKRCKLDPKRFEIIVDKNMPFTCATTGSLKYTNQILLYISESFYNKLASSDQLSQEALFVIRHEIGHVIYDDIGNGSIQLKRLVKITHVASHILASSTLATLGFGPIISTTFGSLTGNFTANRIESAIKLRMERKADEFAVQDPTALKGGIEFFQNKIKENLETRKNLQNWVSKRPPFSPSKELIRGLLLNYLICDEQGNNLLDVNHPPLTERLGHFRELAKQRDL